MPLRAFEISGTSLSPATRGVKIGAARDHFLDSFPLAYFFADAARPKPVARRAFRDRTKDFWTAC